MENSSAYRLKISNPSLPCTFITNDIEKGEKVFIEASNYPSPPFTPYYNIEAPSFGFINSSSDLMSENYEFIPPHITITQPTEIELISKLNDDVSELNVPPLITSTQPHKNELISKVNDDVSELYVDKDFEIAMKLLDLLLDYFPDDTPKQDEEQLKCMEQEEYGAQEKMMVEKTEEIDQTQNEIEEGIIHDGMEVGVEHKLELSETQLSVSNSLVIEQPFLITEDPFPSHSEATCENKDIPFNVSAAIPTPLSTVESCPSPITPIVHSHALTLTPIPATTLKSSFPPTQSLKQRLVAFFKGSLSRKSRSIPSYPKHQDSLYVSHTQIPGATISLCPNQLHSTTSQNSEKLIKEIETPVVRESAKKKTARCLPKFKWNLRNPSKNKGSSNESSGKDRKTQKKNTFTKFKILKKFKLKFECVSGLLSLKHCSKFFSKSSFTSAFTSSSTSTSAGLSPYTPLLHYHEPQSVPLSLLDIQIPLFLFVLWRYIDRDEILSTSGIFRMSSNVENVFAFLEEYKCLSLDKIQNEPLNPNYIYEPTVILKKWLRENPSSIFPSHHNPTLQELSESTICEDTFTALKNVTISLDSTNKGILKLTLYLSRRVLTFSSFNSMNELSLARTIGPNLFTYTDMTSVNAFDWGIRIFNLLLQKDLDYWFT
ncbi:hypothetical protein HMI54_005636 [Coelomomyces lativittatus]|nr:hypothetical protein HMI54_005636 [Coelomomyces lativittatus]